MTDLVSSMSQVDKVLHLYVEVRTVDDKEVVGGHNRGSLRMLQCPDVLPQSHRGFDHTANSHIPDFSPKTPHRSRALSQSLPPSRCSSRHTVNFQLPNQDDARLPAPASDQDTLHGSVGKLSESCTPGRPQSGLNGPYSHFSDWGSQQKWVPEHSSPAVGRWSVPSTPVSYRRFYDRHGADDDNGTTSVVRYGYVKKACVNTGNPQSPLCQNDTDNPFPDNHIHLQKRNSDPGWHRNSNNSMFSNYHPVHTTQNTPILYKRSTLEAVAKDATHRALREFGSPALKHRYESHVQENSTTDRSQQSQHGWSSSSSLRNKSPTLPPRNNQREVTQAQGHSEVIAQPKPQPFPSASSSRSAQRFSPSLHQHYMDSKHLKPYPQSHLPAGKPTDIQDAFLTGNIHTNMPPPICSHKAQNTSDANDCKFDNDFIHFPSYYNMENDSKSNADGSLVSKSGRIQQCYAPVPSMDPHRIATHSNYQNARHDWQTSPVYEQPHSQGDIINHRSAQTMARCRSPLSSPKCRLSSKSLSLPSSLNRSELSHHPEMQSNQCVVITSENNENCHYPYSERKRHHHVSANSVIYSPEVSRRGFLDPHQVHRPSVNQTSRCDVYRRENIANKDQKCGNPVYTNTKEEVPLRNTSLTVHPSDVSFPKQVHADVPCRLGPIQTSSSTKPQTNHVLKQPDARLEKLAKAKWDFLFGAPSEECHFAEAGAPSRHSAGSSVRTPKDSGGQRLLHHKVQQIEVELFTPDPHGPSSGIIRRTLKYSETDLDAVPLRCYQETDLDQVMQAEAEVFGENEAEGDSAFGSILGASNFSSKNVETKEKDSHIEAPKVVPPGTGEKGPRTSREMIRPLDTASECHCSLKSPVALSSPCCSSDSNMDSFSRHFENIMESHRAKGTSYSSLDSVDVLTTGSTSVFTFDLPTLTPEIQTQISDTARQLMDLSFAPLSRSLLPGVSLTSASEVSPSASKLTQVQNQSSANTVSAPKEGFKKVSSAPSLHSSVREHVKRPPELLYPQSDVAQRLAHADTINALNGIKTDQQAAKRLAQRLYSLDGFKKSDVARHLNKNNEFSHSVAEEYLSLFDFSSLTIDQALRLFLRRLALVGETQERERLLTHFSHRYTQCNPHCLNSEDSIHTLTCAVMLLNSDLHGNNLGKRMSCSQFITNLEGLNDGKDFPKELLKMLYTSIRSEKLQWTIDEEEVQKPGTTVAPDARKDSASHTLKRQGPSGNPLLSMAQQANEQIYKSGLLVRKVHADQDGKRTPRGKRGWKCFYGTLKGLVLYLQKEEYRSGQELTQEDLKNAVSIHHSLAMRAVDYSKRANVFYLRTADWRVFLFQAPSAEQMQSWITRINIVSAMFSAPPFPPAIGSQKKFSRPLLPGSNTKLSQEEQLKSHENRFRAVSTELTELIADLKVKGQDAEEQKQRQEYLEFEKTRYGTYAMLMRAKLQLGTEDLSVFESRLLSEGGLQRAHSSPALPQYSSLKDRGPSSKSKSLKAPSIKPQTKEESQNGTKPDGKAENKTEIS